MTHVVQQNLHYLSREVLEAAQANKLTKLRKKINK